MNSAKNSSNSFINTLLRMWRFLFAILVPLIFSPLLFDYDNKPYLCCYVLVVMALYWMFEPINLYITSMIPIALFPLFGIASTDEVCFNYMKGTVMMFIGGLIMGIALEHSNLHRRVALKIIIFFGSSYKNLMAGIMLATMFQSMWINNTATTAMMIPIVDSILVEMNSETSTRNKRDHRLLTSSADPENDSTVSLNIDAKLERQDSASHSSDGSISFEQLELKKKENMKVLRTAMLLAIVYAANIGGTASLTGTGTNLVLQEVFLIEFPTSTALTFSTWMIYALPSALVTILVSWLFLTFYYISKHDETPETSKMIRASAVKKYEELGSLTSHEIGVLIHFIILVLLWFFRSPGWTNWITDDKHQIKDATPAILVAISMFIVPANPRDFLPTSKNDTKSRSDIKRLLNWRVVQTGITWGVVFLLGGGFALAYGIQRSGLAKLFADLLTRITLHPSMTTITLILISACVTQITSNVATANVILPVISEMAVQMHVNPLMFIVPVTISISFAFMFPVSSPSNAIVYEHLRMSVVEMAKPGIWMNIIAVIIQIVFVNMFGRFVFDLNTFPDWAAVHSSNATSYYLG